MSIAVQLCGLLLLSVVLYFYLSCKKVFLNTESAFFMSVVSSVFFMVADIVAVILMKNSGNVNIHIINITLFLIQVIR